MLAAARGYSFHITCLTDIFFSKNPTAQKKAVGESRAQFPNRAISRGLPGAFPGVRPPPAQCTTAYIVDV